MQAERTKTAFATLAIVGALAYLFFAMKPNPPLGDRKPHEALGQVVAEEACKLVGSGGKIFVITRDTSVLKNPAIDFQMRAFAKAVAKTKNVIASTNLIKLEPLYLPRVQPPSVFVELIRRAQPADVIVSFLGPPLIPEEERARLGEKRPKIIAMCSGPMPRMINLKTIFAQDLLHLAIVSRSNPEAKPPKSDDPRLFFDQYYQLITQSNLNELPVPAPPPTR